jgi:hypothetical protein
MIHVINKLLTNSKFLLPSDKAYTSLIILILLAINLRAD